MNYQDLLESAQSLPAHERAMLILALSDLADTSSIKMESPRLAELLNKQGVCRQKETNVPLLL